MDIQPLNKGFAFLKVDDNMTLHEIRRLRPVPDACLNVDDAFGRRARAKISKGLLGYGLH